jgi:hypothetical protein
MRRVISYEYEIKEFMKVYNTNIPRHDRRLGGPQSRFGRGGEEKNSQPPPRIEP